MALYSMNRVSSIAAVQEAQAALEESEINGIMAELDECAYDEDAMNLLETCIVIEETDHKMFNALIEKDFITVQNESVLTEADAAEANDKADETAKKSLKEKIGSIINTVIEGIKSAFTWIKTKIEEMAAKFTKENIFAQLTKNFTSTKIKGRKIKAGAEDVILDTAAIGHISDATGAAIDKIIYKKEDVGASKDRAGEAVNEIIENILKDKTGKCFEAEGEYEVDMTYIDKICVPAIKNYKKTIDIIKQYSASVIKDLNSLRVKALKDHKGNSEADNAIYSITITACKGYSKIYNQMKNLTVMEKNEARKAILAAIAHNKKAAKEEEKTEAPEESAIDFMGDIISESCDAYLALA